MDRIDRSTEMNGTSIVAKQADEQNQQVREGLVDKLSGRRLPINPTLIRIALSIGTLITAGLISGAIKIP